MLVSDINLRKRRLDFSSSGQGRVDATELLVNGTQVANAVELLDFSEDMVQLLVCEACGVTGCEPGSWVSFRRVDKHIVLIPAIHAMREGDWEANEYSPPKFMLKNGPVVFESPVYEALRDKTGRFPNPERVRRLSSGDALGLLQLTAPGRVLGTLGLRAALNLESIVAVTEGNLESEVNEFLELIDMVNNGVDDLHSGNPLRVTEFHLDIPTFPAWRPFGYDSDEKAVLNLGALMHPA